MASLSRILWGDTILFRFVISQFCLHKADNFSQEIQTITALLIDFRDNVANETQRGQVSTILNAGFPYRAGLRYQPGVDYVSVLLDLAELHKKPTRERLVTEIPPMAVSIACGVAPHLISMMNGHGKTWRAYLRLTLKPNLGAHINSLPEEDRAYLREIGTRVVDNVERILGGRSEFLDKATPVQKLKAKQTWDINLITRRMLENFGVSEFTAANVLDEHSFYLSSLLNSVWTPPKAPALRNIFLKLSSNLPQLSRQLSRPFPLKPRLLGCPRSARPCRSKYHPPSRPSLLQPKTTHPQLTCPSSCGRVARHPIPKHHRKRSLLPPFQPAVRHWRLKCHKKRVLPRHHSPKNPPSMCRPLSRPSQCTTVTRRPQSEFRLSLLATIQHSLNHSPLWCQMYPLSYHQLLPMRCNNRLPKLQRSPLNLPSPLALNRPLRFRVLFLKLSDCSHPPPRPQPALPPGPRLPNSQPLIGAKRLSRTWLFSSRSNSVL